MNEIGHSYLCNDRPAHVPKCRTRSRDFVKVQCKIKSRAHKMRGRGLRMPQKAQVIDEPTVMYFANLAGHA